MGCLSKEARDMKAAPGAARSPSYHGSSTGNKAWSDTARLTLLDGAQLPGQRQEDEQAESRKEQSRRPKAEQFVHQGDGPPHSRRSCRSKLHLRQLIGHEG